MQTVYIQGTKKAANEKLSKNESVNGIIYSMYDDSEVDLLTYDQAAVIKFWTKRDHVGTPIAKSYGTFDPLKKKIK